ncbi:MAG TPA: exodeoxyribonuclease III [Candidatus Avidehalobacter gallistercoris]|uniref:Exodeoxyribonuclease III n=1 Tax=Candidatus Avidehalobacter gallistercoris TaxID=2840694 RepID=A0A9D1KZT2_9FIRM|nr:exodeoxyribonuclease III [Candidatus Avidehalobacter gallistercoris]
MKLISWNVNGLRACINKGFYNFAENSGADIISVQETKMQPGQAEVELAGYNQFWNSAEKKGYSGTLVFSKAEPQSVAYNLGLAEHNDEGRAVTLEYEQFYLVNIYVPNAQDGLARIDYRLRWEDDFRAYVQRLDKLKPVIICGDMNVAHEEIDLKNPKTNRGNAGFSDEERGKFSELLAAGFVDSFRYLHPDETGAYSWWSYRFNARKNNAGWRIDYFLVSERLADEIKAAYILPEVMGSDHCPVVLEIF